MEPAVEYRSPRVAVRANGRPPRDVEGRAWWLLASVVATASLVAVVGGLLPEPVVRAPGPGLTDSSDLALALAFEPEVLADIAQYRGPRRLATSIARSLAVLVPLMVAAALVGPRGERWVQPLRRIPGVALPVGAALAATAMVTTAARLPVSIWAGVVQDGVWGFRTRSVPGWFLDHLGVLVGRALLLALLTGAVVALVRRHPRTWPARLTVLAAVAGPVALLLHPLLVHPLLLPTGPMPDGPHRDAVVAVVARSSVDVPVLLGEASLRTTRRNAVATGLGPTQRIVLHDTLLELDPRAVAAITAHELAHIERHDPIRGVLAPVPIVLLVGLALRRRLADRPRARLEEVRVLATAAVLVLAVEAAATPLSAGLSRTVEHRTDVRAVQLVGDTDAYVALLRSFVIDGLAEPDPPRWSVLLWATHPTPATRITAVLDTPAQLSGSGDPTAR